MKKRRPAVLVSTSAAMFVGTSGPDMTVGSRWDEIGGGHGRDLMRGGEDGVVDRVDCGPGADTVIVGPIPPRLPRHLYVNCEIRSSPIQPHR